MAGKDEYRWTPYGPIPSQEMRRKAKMRARKVQIGRMIDRYGSIPYCAMLAAEYGKYGKGNKSGT